MKAYSRHKRLRQRRDLRNLVVTRRVPSLRSVRHLLQVHQCRRVSWTRESCTSSMDGRRRASSRASPARACVLERSNSVASERPRVPRRRPYRSVGCPAPDRLPLRTGRYAWYETPKPPPPPLKPLKPLFHKNDSPFQIRTRVSLFEGGRGVRRASGRGPA